MSIKGGQILHVAGAGFIVDRLQTGGITGITVNEDRLEELGNYEAIGTVRDIPDLTFELESYDSTTELESILTGGDNTEAAGTVFNLGNFTPIDILSPYKTSGAFTIDNGSVAIPFLSLESMSYNMSLSDPMTMTATLRGDSAFFIPGAAYRETFVGDNVTTAFNFTNGPALQSVIAGSTYFALSVTVDGKRQRIGTDYTNTATGITFTTAPATSAVIAVVYGSATPSTYLQTVHNTTDPAGVRGRDIFIRLDPAGGTAYTDWLGVQSATVDWRVTLERDEEFGNAQVVAQDFDVPEVDGSVTMKPVDVSALITQIQRVANLTATDIANATQDPPETALEIKITNPADGSTMKTLRVNDAKWTMPALSGTVGSKLETDFSFTSASGVLQVIKGDPV